MSGLLLWIVLLLLLLLLLLLHKNLVPTLLRCLFAEKFQQPIAIRGNDRCWSYDAYKYALWGECRGIVRVHYSYTPF